MFAGIGLEVTNVRPPADVEYTMVVVGGDGSELEVDSNLAGFAPLDCGDQDHRDVVFVFPDMLASVVAVALLWWRLRMTRSAFEDHGQWWLGIAAAVLMGACLLFVARKWMYGTRLGHLRPYYLFHLWAGAAWAWAADTKRSRGFFASSRRSQSSSWGGTGKRGSKVPGSRASCAWSTATTGPSNSGRPHNSSHAAQPTP